MKKVLSVFVYAVFFILLYIMCYCFDLISQNVKNAFELCINSVIPSLFPFFIMAELMLAYMNNHPPNKIALLYQKIFKFDKSTLPVFVSGLISGYPVGAYMTQSLYQKNLISKTDAKDLICFTNNSGPMFIICAIGIGIFKSLRIGIILYLIHIASAIITGITISILRKNTYYQNSSVTKSEIDISKLIEQSFFKCIKICGFIIFFAVINSFVDILLYKFNNISVYVSLIVEITNGINKASKYFDIPYSLCHVSFAASFSGISVMLQVRSIIHQEISLKKYIIFKLYNGCVAFVLCSLYFNIERGLIFDFCFMSIIIMAIYIVFKKSTILRLNKKRVQIN